MTLMPGHNPPAAGAVAYGLTGDGASDAGLAEALRRAVDGAEDEHERARRVAELVLRATGATSVLVSVEGEDFELGDRRTGLGLAVGEGECAHRAAAEHADAVARLETCLDAAACPALSAPYVCTYGAATSGAWPVAELAELAEHAELAELAAEVRR